MDDASMLIRSFDLENQHSTAGQKSLRCLLVTVCLIAGVNGGDAASNIPRVIVPAPPRVSPPTPPRVTVPTPMRAAIPTLPRSNVPTVNTRAGGVTTPQVMQSKTQTLTTSSTPKSANTAVQQRTLSGSQPVNSTVSASAKSGSLPQGVSPNTLSHASGATRAGLLVSAPGAPLAVPKDGNVKGTLVLQSTDGKTKISLNSLANVTTNKDGKIVSTDGSATSPNQCPELIVRYANAVDPKLKITSVGDGKDAAKSIATQAKDQFQYVDGKSSASLPAQGAVISIGPWDKDKNGRGGNEYGHTGIVSKVIVNDIKNPTKATATLFDQNFPGDKWKEVTFTKQSDGTWKGEMPNTPIVDLKKGEKPITTYAQVTGWANPTDDLKL
jgi:hypothetical protein